ncbi:MAG TPA: tRNA lysidine(34) synthetase TilS, partial [Gammaproteobacteria bacterium]|nr:tRNA lysidine(34) synthetase TilS [Gammaproteobacteria bacterium]
MAQLHATHKFKSLRVVHINHGLNPQADAWEKHCRQTCEALSIPFFSKKITLDIKSGESIEALARQERYAVFRRLIKPDENIVTAHTKEDQAETFLLQLLRGAGPKGLSAMPEKKIMGAGCLLRPLLHTRRAELVHYAKLHRLKWIEDDTNAELRFNRNYLRHQIFPVLQKRWPESVFMIARSAQHCAEASSLLDELADLDLSVVQHGNQLSLEKLLSLSERRQRNVLRRWIARQGYRAPNTKHMDQIQNHLIKARSDANPIFSWDETEIRRYQNYLYLLPSVSQSNKAVKIPWDFKNPIQLPHEAGVLIAVKKEGEGISAAMDTSQVTIRFRQGGERCRPQ